MNATTPSKKTTSPKRTMRVIAGACAILGVTLLTLGLNCLPGYRAIQQWRDQTKTLPAVSVNAVIEAVRSGLVLLGLLSFLFFFFAVLLWRAQKKISD